MENETLEKIHLSIVVIGNCTGNSVDCPNHSANASVSFRHRIASYDLQDENEEVGLLLASKAIVQLIMNPVIGPLTNRYAFYPFIIHFIMCSSTISLKDAGRKFLSLEISSISF
ncbi:hypothetical protein AVEN_143645-1 [Araneus ventricosus]|uniref:Uncharacterized protein n=1 Tax=Araneus ventricosus TaxID=182803 RepID=A0A4Y2AQ50_ARAVE|nr:hypothetical protein AVEN_143645-1 [Araneus ventricosus]